MKEIPTQSPEIKPDAPVPGRRSRGIAVAVYSGLLLLAFGPTLAGLVFHAAGSELHSYILLIPFISAYLIFIQRDQLPGASAGSPVLGSLFMLAGFLALGLALRPDLWAGGLSVNDYFTLITFSFIALLVAGGFFFLGRKWMASVAFPVAFLFFTVPMPDAMADALETASQLASAEAASLFLSFSGTPFLREGTIFELPNITIRVAQECSGIRSSWILLITSLLASYLFLRASWRRAVLVALVIPLGILRNGFRILVVGLLCVHYGPPMINSVIHRRGGPLFFVLALIPLFLVLWWLRRGEAGFAKTAPEVTGAETEIQ